MIDKFAADDLLRIKVTLQLTYATDAGISFRGQRLLSYDMNSNCINNHFYSPDEPSRMTLEADLYVDRNMAEVFIDGGAMSYSMGLDGRENKGYEFFGNELRVKKLEVYKLKR